MISGVSDIWPLSATWLVTSVLVADRGTMSAEPARTSMLGGMLFMLRRSLSLIPTRCEMADTLMLDGTVQAVQLAYWPLVWASKLRWNTAALSQGSRMRGVPAAMMTGRCMDGFSALKSSMRTSASLAANSTSMSRVTSTVWK